MNNDAYMMEIGRICEIVRYPVKSMAGMPTKSGFLGWHGLDGDRRFAFRRLGEEGGFPWLSASRFPNLVRYNPSDLDESTGEPLPTHVRTPAGLRVGLRSPELQAEITNHSGNNVELMYLKHGIFDEAPISVLSLATIATIERAAGFELDRRRFRTNIMLETKHGEPFVEDTWVGRTLVFGNTNSGPAVALTLRDLRCMMINLDPDTAIQDARVMKAVVHLNQNNAGVYATVVRTGTVCVGDRVALV